jgi:hypothetical protein
MTSRSIALTVVIVWLSSALCLAQPSRQQTGGEINLTASSANVSQSGNPVNIRILRWSTDEERSPVVAALNPTTPTATTAGSPVGAATSATTAAGSPAEAAPNPSAAGDRGGAARGGRGGAGRGGRGRRGAGNAAAPLTPIAALAAAIARAPTVGYIWTNDVTGYSIKYAYRTSLPEGGERIIVATDRRLGAYTAAWAPTAASPATDYDFTLVEIRLDSKGLGEGKTSLTTKVVLDTEAKTVALDNYTATPAILQTVKR